MATKEKHNLFEGMVFRMRICTAKSRLKRILEENGGRFIKAGEKADSIINLTDDSEETQGIHIDYILHSVQKKKLQPIENYDLSKPRITSKSMRSDAKLLGKGRQAYQPEEDEVIIQYVTKHQAEYGNDGSTGGNLIWKNMEKQGITTHTWQSMKSRYNTHLQHRAPSFTYQPITFRNCGSSTVPYAVSRDSPLPDEEAIHPIEKKKKTDGGTKKKVKKLYSFNENSVMYAKTPPTQGENISEDKENSQDQECSQNISELTTPETSTCELVKSQEDETDETNPSNRIQTSVEQEQNDSFVFESYSGDTPCDGIVQRHNNDIHSPEEHHLLKPRETSTTIKQSQDEHLQQFCAAFEESDAEDEFDQQLFEQAAQSKKIHLEIKEKKRTVTKKHKSEDCNLHEYNEFDIEPCECSFSKDYTKAFQILEEINNLPDDFNWKAVCERIDF